jgi:hypothetical protein
MGGMGVTAHQIEVKIFSQRHLTQACLRLQNTSNSAFSALQSRENVRCVRHVGVACTDELLRIKKYPKLARIAIVDSSTCQVHVSDQHGVLTKFTSPALISTSIK